MFNMKMIVKEHAKVTQQLKTMETQIMELTAEVLDLKDEMEKIKKEKENTVVLN